MCADSTGIRKGAVALSSGGGYAPLVGGRCEVCAADEFRDGESCVEACTAGKVTLGRKCVTPAEKCEGRGWPSIYGNTCGVNVWIIETDVVDNGCTYDSGGECYDYFGPNLDFPQAPADNSRPYYLHNCDPDGTRGLIPATANTIGLTESRECECANPDQIRQGAVRSTQSEGGYSPLLGGQCVCPAGKVGSADGLSCVCPANMVAEGEGCACPAGTTDLQGYCVSAAEKAGAEKCTEAGWTFADGACAIPVSTGGTVSAGCQIGAGGSGVSCADAFGEGFGFPAKPSSLFAVAAYVYDCVGDATPSGANQNGETTCQCQGENVYVEGECVEGTAENKCKAKGWEVTENNSGQKFCGVNVVNGLVGLSGGVDRFLEGCLLTENPRPGDDGCHLEFGLDFNFPQRPADGGSPYYAINCGTASGAVPAHNGLLPAGMADGAMDCYCEDSTATRFGATMVGNGAGVTLRYDGVCLSDEDETRAAGGCEMAGWDLEPEGDKGWRCAIPVMQGTMAAETGCFVSGMGAPRCSEVFGRSYAFPMTTATAVTFAFDCGEKMIPEGVNLRGETSCECAAENADGDCICGGGRTENADGECVCAEGKAEMGGVCVPEEGAFGGSAGGVAGQVELCEAFGGEVLKEGEVAYGCRGLDEAGTFCLLGSEEVFPCRGLFLRARDCNVGYGRPRPLLNPFICGSVCPSQTARGRHCE